ncbi:bis(5'-nucleosyl)-tetraphosphatase [Candidatus Aenigmatarchaeota archaeon]
MISERSAGAVVYRECEDDKKYLLLLYLGGHWDFPKGNIEKDENEIDTVVREVEEETGISDIDFIEGFRHSIKYFYKRDGNLVNKEVVFFVTKTSTEKVKISHEHKDFIWLDFDEAMKKLTFSNSKEILKRANSYLGKKRSLKDFSG